MHNPDDRDRGVRPETISVITAAPRPARRRRPQAGPGYALFITGCTLVGLQLGHGLRFGWLYTLYWLLAISAGWALIWVIRRTA